MNPKELQFEFIDEPLVVPANFEHSSDYAGYNMAFIGFMNNHLGERIYALTVSEEDQRLIVLKAEGFTEDKAYQKYFLIQDEEEEKSVQHLFDTFFELLKNGILSNEITSAQLPEFVKTSDDGFAFSIAFPVANSILQ
jgi:hypothetical protein